MNTHGFTRGSSSWREASLFSIPKSWPSRGCHSLFNGRYFKWASGPQPHHQLNPQGPGDWLQEDHSDVHSLVHWERLETEERSPLLARVSSGILSVLGR